LARTGATVQHAWGPDVEMNLTPSLDKVNRITNATICRIAFAKVWHHFKIAHFIKHEDCHNDIKAFTQTRRYGQYLSEYVFLYRKEELRQREIWVTLTPIFCFMQISTLAYVVHF
jgi:hypothetical protein